MKLEQINQYISVSEAIHFEALKEKEIKGLAFDSRKVEQGFLFIAIKGTQTDGHHYIEKSIEQGAVAVICETLPEQLNSKVGYLKVEDSEAGLALLASAWYGFPSKKLQLIGVTGTNGKTTIATLLYRLFLRLNYKVGLISTISNRINETTIPSTHTTPDALQLNALLNEMVQNGCQYCFMEVSSHAICQKRIAGLEYKGGIFTNITHDHLDYHKTFKAYLTAKKAFFDNLPKTAFALTNIDDKNGLVMLQNTSAKKTTYSCKNIADYKCRAIENHFDGSQLEMNGVEFWTPLIGDFNVYNLGAIIGTALELGEEMSDVLTELSALRSVDGRFETLYSADKKVAIVDYAHTPDALENVLETISQLRQMRQQLITVVGAGGNRDTSKRPIMAEIACRYSDKLILTSDNPRYEEPEKILDDMEAGIPKAQQEKVLRITDREQAIKTAILLSKPNDIILVAGKGHEDYQDIKGVKHHFDDKEIIIKHFKQ